MEEREKLYPTQVQGWAFKMKVTQAVRHLK
jgi:hypothetical protein